MGYLIMAFSLFVAGMIQAAPWLSIAKPPALLGVVLYYALTRERRRMLVAAVAGGFIQDALGMSPIGYSSVCFGLIGLIVNHFRNLLFTLRMVTHIVVGAVAAGAGTLCLGILLSSAGHIAGDSTLFLSRILAATALGAVTVPLVFRFVDFLDTRLGTYGGAMP
jgi:rod shape-determining protein MreD